MTQTHEAATTSPDRTAKTASWGAFALTRALMGRFGWRLWIVPAVVLLAAVASYLSLEASKTSSMQRLSSGWTWSALIFSLVPWTIMWWRWAVPFALSMGHTRIVTYAVGLAYTSGLPALWFFCMHALSRWEGQTNPFGGLTIFAGTPDVAFLPYSQINVGGGSMLAPAGSPLWDEVTVTDVATHAMASTVSWLCFALVFAIVGTVWAAWGLIASVVSAAVLTPFQIWAGFQMQAWVVELDVATDWQVPMLLFFNGVLLLPFLYTPIHAWLFSRVPTS
ncbi:hypothetical protein [Ornithinimicrobium sp. INDO-MA30-4]|uniref:hypothetical protein n=1 Tax=Ornithinimicrobium sp. INDO-MA30-4 TaxID=2908651 RepID=UPI001F490837|nr:hypothetical protein [Ornithinimicrobium sp. INDO-MA30-4]UJH70933.1 hypothetical protein L0A91_02930 [Ornithinimicrobium sp. INDO-MA30-4]